MSTRPTVLITGASTGIGAVYAERFAQRGHDLVLVARDQARLDALAARLRSEHRVAIDVMAANLTQPRDLTAVETRLRDDARIGILVNNAGTALSGSFIEQSTDSVAQLVALNTTALVRLASAIAPRLAKAGDGAIINIGSVVGLAPEFGMTVYGATKAFVLFLSQGLSLELSPGRVRASRAAGGYPHGDLGPLRRRHQHPERHHGSRRSGGRGTGRFRSARTGDDPAAATGRTLG